MGARMVAFLESLLSGLDCLDCLAEKGKPESKRHKLETPQLMSRTVQYNTVLSPRALLVVSRRTVSEYWQHHGLSPYQIRK